MTPKKGKSEDAGGEAIKKEVKAGKPQKQATAEKTARSSKRGTSDGYMAK